MRFNAKCSREVIFSFFHRHLAGVVKTTQICWRKTFSTEKHSVTLNAATRAKKFEIIKAEIGEVLKRFVTVHLKLIKELTIAIADTGYLEHSSLSLENLFP